MLNGIPDPTTPPSFDVTKFKLYIPKLKWWVEDNANLDLYNLAVEKMRLRLNYSYWQEEWEEAMSLAVAHFIIITDPRFAQSTDSDATAGGVMKSRSVAGVSYDYDIEYYLEKNVGYGYFNTTGYGRRLIALANARGWIGIFTS
ncbi:MAG: DUF4054 domain-containing protein [Bacilli bacterium]